MSVASFERLINQRSMRSAAPKKTLGRQQSLSNSKLNEIIQLCFDYSVLLQVASVC